MLSYLEPKNIIINELENIDTGLENFYPNEKNKSIDNLEHISNTTTELFSNKKSIANIKRNNHYLSSLLNDYIIITENYNMIFKNLTLGLSIGITNQAILLTMKKEDRIKDYKKLLKSYTEIDKISKEKHTSDIAFIKEYIDFIENTNSKYLPLKILADKLHMTESQVKGLAKAIFNHNKLPKQFNKFTSIPTKK